MSRKNSIFIIIIIILIVMSGCSAQNKPETTVSEFIEAMKRFDSETMALKVNPKNVNRKDQVSSLHENEEDEYQKYFLDYMKSNAKKIIYKIENVEINGDDAIVGVDLKYIDGIPVFAATFSEYITEMFSMAFSEEELTNEENLEIFISIMQNQSESIKESYIEKSIDIKCIKIDNVWYIDNPSEELLDAAMSNILSIGQEINDSFKSTSNEKSDSTESKFEPDKIDSDHRLVSLDINVFIKPDGSAIIKEERLVNLVEGTESYIVIDNLGKSEIKDFIVYENGEKFQYIDNWNMNAPREEKAKKNSILSTSTGVELSWGVGEYGRHEYTLEYTITNFVKQLEDSQMIFWRFVNDDTNIPPEEVKITISSDYEFSEENQRIWGFGFDGDIQFENRKVVAKSNRPLSRNNYVTVLMKFPQGMFSTNDILNQSFQEILDEAFVGSDY